MVSKFILFKDMVINPDYIIRATFHKAGFDETEEREYPEFLHIYLNENTTEWTSESSAVSISKRITLSGEEAARVWQVICNESYAV